ncbi:MAG TPA: hypothetical protein VF857_11135, partial [Spirochaetota bacterium]
GDRFGWKSCAQTRMPFRYREMDRRTARKRSTGNAVAGSSHISICAIALLDAPTVVRRCRESVTPEGGCARIIPEHTNSLPTGYSHRARLTFLFQ